ncbi:MAG: heparinase II/III family protein [Candidatus Latescibacteria bacterium]|nr:heparinase II/III family protein [Candidatus Latescibacterota bacterium]
MAFMTLLSPDSIHLARHRLTQDASARTIVDRMLASVSPWMTLSDEAIRALIPDARVPRSFSVNYMTGCPVHGSGPRRLSGYTQGGWQYDPFTAPWTVTCGIGGESYPSNDFGAFYRTGLDDRSLLTGPYPDDGWGWRAEAAGFRHWFIAYCCESLWHAIIQGVTTLARAYVLTGEAGYARTALIMLDRIADVYPAMDYHTQSMYAVEFSPQYTGKVFNQISEAGVLKGFAEAYDGVHDALIDIPDFAPRAAGMRAHIERNILIEGIEAVYRGQVRSNYGGHQEALLTAVLVLGDRQRQEEAVDWVLRNTGEATLLKEMLTSFDDYLFRDKAAHAEGLDFALDNLLFREGIGWESSPGYCASWVEHLSRVARLLERLGVSVWDRPKIRRMFSWPSEIVCLDRFTPAIGDAGSVVGGLVELSNDALRTAYEQYRDPLFAYLLQTRAARRDEGVLFESVDDLFAPPLALSGVDDGARQYRTMTTGSRLLGGYGLALLRSGEGEAQTAVAVYYGRAATEHAHFDRLNLEVFAYGKKLIPDLGYPEHAAEGETPPVWTKNTAAHATVVVDERRQDTQAAGRLLGFVSLPGLQFVDIDAPETYRHTAQYRRTTALVDLGPDARYVIDLFRVTGGVQHDYSLHGFDAPFLQVDGLTVTARPGTLAGEAVPFMDIYDEPDLRDPARKGRSYYTYRGSGYSYLDNVRRGRPDRPWSVTWQESEDRAGLRIWFPVPSDEAIFAAGPPPRKPGLPDQLTYVILRNRGDTLASRFVSVIEPFRDSPKTNAVSALSVCDEDGRPVPAAVGLRIEHPDGVDVVIQGGDCGLRIADCGLNNPKSKIQNLKFSGRLGLIRWDRAGRVTRLDLIGAGMIETTGVALRLPGGLSGTVSAVEDEPSMIVVEWDARCRGATPRALVGEMILIGNTRHGAAYTITDIDGDSDRCQVRFGVDSCRIGRFIVSGHGSDGRSLVTKTYLYLAAQGYYRGTWLVNADRSVWVPVDDIVLASHRPGFRRDARVSVVEPVDLTRAFPAGSIAWLYDCGPGDRVEVIPHATAIRRDDGGYDIIGEDGVICGE